MAVGVYPVKAKGIGRVIYGGSFITVASSNPTVTTGAGFTVVRSGAGVYVVTLSEAVSAIEALSLTVGMKTEATELTVNSDPDNLSTQAFTVRVAAGGTPGDDAGSRVDFIALCRVSSVDY